jgi:hypothetical protein
MLCGKALSRIWAGTGEGFCSREHRNQYRLRRGMDRLIEANKVANVMRRRENPRQVPPPTLRNSGASSPRNFENLQVPRDFTAAGLAGRNLRPILENGFDATGRFRAPRANSGREHTGVIAESSPLRLEGQYPLPPRLALRIRVQSAQAPPAVKGVPAVSAGPALRVSMAARFRVPQTNLQSVRVPGPEIPGLAWPGIRPLSRPGAAGQAIPATFAMAIAEPPTSIPAAPPADQQNHFEWPGAIRIRMQFVDCETGRWTATAPFGYPDDLMEKERR